MTNRQWISEMDNRTLSKFLTFGIMVRTINFHSDPFPISISEIARQYTSSALGIEMWLSEAQQYEILKGGVEE